MSRTKLEGLWELVSLQSCDAVGTGISIVQCIRNGATPTSLGLKPLRRHDLPTPGSPERGGLSADVERLRRTKTNPGGRSVTCNRTLTNDYSLESENKRHVEGKKVACKLKGPEMKSASRKARRGSHERPRAT